MDIFNIQSKVGWTEWFLLCKLAATNPTRELFRYQTSTLQKHLWLDSCHWWAYLTHLSPILDSCCSKYWTLYLLSHLHKPWSLYPGWMWSWCTPREQCNPSSLTSRVTNLSLHIWSEYWSLPPCQHRIASPYHLRIVRTIPNVRTEGCVSPPISRK